MYRGTKDARNARKRHWGAGLPLAVIGIGLLGSAVHLEKQDHDFEGRAVHATATIIQTVHGQRSNQDRYLLSFDPATHLPDEWTSGGHVSGQVGATVEVIYDPSDPSNLEETSALGMRHWLPAVLLGGLGVVVLGLAAMALHGERRPRT